jgi:hypothetical protein
MKEKEINKIATEFLNLRKGCIPRTDMSLKKLLVDFYDYAWRENQSKAEDLKILAQLKQKYPEA